MKQEYTSSKFEVDSSSYSSSVLYTLFSEAKLSHFTDIQPMSIGEIKFYFNDIDYEALSDSGKQVYKRVSDFLQKDPNLLNGEYIIKRDSSYALKVNLLLQAGSSAEKVNFEIRNREIRVSTIIKLLFFIVAVILVILLICYIKENWTNIWTSIFDFLKEHISGIFVFVVVIVILIDSIRGR